MGKDTRISKETYVYDQILIPIYLLLFAKNLKGSGGRSAQERKQRKRSIRTGYVNVG